MKIFKLDFWSIFTVVFLFILGIVIHDFIEIQIDENSGKKELIYSWIRLISATLTSIYLVIFLIKKRKNKIKN